MTPPIVLQLCLASVLPKRNVLSMLAAGQKALTSAVNSTSMPASRCKHRNDSAPCHLRGNRRGKSRTRIRTNPGRTSLSQDDYRQIAHQPKSSACSNCMLSRANGAGKYFIDRCRKHCNGFIPSACFHLPGNANVSKTSTLRGILYTDTPGPLDCTLRK